MGNYFNMAFRIYALLACCAHIGVVIGLKLKNVTIPQYGSRGGFVKLECNFDLDSDTLLSLKWYKDGHEFFRYLPNPKSPIMTFPINGVHVDLNLSGLNQLYLRNITLQTEGTYKCEVSADRPTFKTLDRQGDMIVIAPPASGPEITGLREVVSAGDLLKGNCTSRRTKPAASLMFYINGIKMENGETEEFIPEKDEDGLETAVLGFKLQVEPSHFQNGVIEIKCTATIGNSYWVSKKSISDASINAQPSSPGHNRLSSGNFRGQSVAGLLQWMTLIFAILAAN